jgi:hypothetical protein
LSVLVLDSGGLSRLAERSLRSASMLGELSREGLWPPVVPTVVLVESLQGEPARDANANRILKGCLVRPVVTVELARRAAHLRRLAQRGSAVDAIVVATAEPAGMVLTSDLRDLGALAEHATGVEIMIV